MTTTLKNSRSDSPVGDDDLFWESKVAKTLGLPRERVRALREAHLSPDEWVLRGNAVVLTARGLEKITALAAANAGAPSEAVVEAIEAGPPAVARLVVARLCGNPRLLQAQRVGVVDGALLLVRVKSNEHFMAGMEFDAMATGEGTWQFTGRLPRRKGRW